MDFLHHLALTLHIVFFAIWIGNLFAIAVTLAFRNDQNDAAVRTTLGTLTRKKGRVADIGATLTILTGAWLDPGSRRGITSASPGFTSSSRWSW